jgi:hypothetical protein
MWWYGYGWWWWWIAFLIIFFLIPVGYGWGYRGWGPWYGHRRTDVPRAAERAAAEEAAAEAGWGMLGCFVWIILIIAILWLIAALAWYPR